MQNIQRLCVYCGSSGAVDARYREAAYELGTRLAAAGIGLVYGGGRVGLIVVDSMHERKRLMAEKADAFAILPGGLGTLDETFEIVSWKQLELHDKPILLVDIGGYWAPLRALLDHIVAKGFARPETRGLLRIVPTVAALMTALAAEPAPRLAIDSERF